MKNLNTLLLALSLITSSLFIGNSAFAKNSKSAGNEMRLGENVAVMGYDPVSYFPEGGSDPKKGFVLRSFDHNGLTYRFASDANMAKFKASPEKFLPQYGGWCAWAVAKLGKKVDVDPEAYVVRDGKLYLFYGHKELDTKKDWLANVAEFLPKGDANWAKLTK